MKIELFSGRVIKRISIAIGLFFLMGLLLTGGLLGLISHPDLVGDLLDMPTGNSLVPDVQPLPVADLNAADCTRVAGWWVTVRREFIQPYESDMNLTRYSRDTEDYLPGKLNDLQNHTANFREIEIPICMPPIIHSNIQNIENHMQHFNHELALLLAAPAHYSGDFTADVYGPVQAGLDEATDAVDQFVRTKYMNSNTGEEN